MPASTYIFFLCFKSTAMRAVVALLMLAAVAAASTATEFDQFTDVSGAVRNMPRGQLWQVSAAAVNHESCALLSFSLSPSLVRPTACQCKHLGG